MKKNVKIDYEKTKTKTKIHSTNNKRLKMRLMCSIEKKSGTKEKSG